MSSTGRLHGRRRSGHEKKRTRPAGQTVSICSCAVSATITAAAFGLRQVYVTGGTDCGRSPPPPPRNTEPTRTRALTAGTDSRDGLRGPGRQGQETSTKTTLSVGPTAWSTFSLQVVSCGFSSSHV